MDTQKATTEFRMSQWAKIIQAGLTVDKVSKIFASTNGISRTCILLLAEETTGKSLYSNRSSGRDEKYSARRMDATGTKAGVHRKRNTGN
jgi:tagatose-1,6-bisphosphate aldolase